MKHDPSEDRTLLHRLRDGDDLALNGLLARWERPLFAFAWRYTGNTADSQDLVSETFVRLYHARLRLRKDTNVSAWLFTTLSNLCHNRHRWIRRHPTVSIDEPVNSDGTDASDLVGSDPTPREMIEQREVIDTVRTGLDGLPHDLKTTLLLHHFEGLSCRDIAPIVGCSERGVETRLYRARKQLRKEVDSLLARIPGAATAKTRPPLAAPTSSS